MCKSLSLKRPSFTKFNNMFKEKVDEVMEMLGKVHGESSESEHEADEDEDPADRGSVKSQKSKAAASTKNAGKVASTKRAIIKPKSKAAEISMTQRGSKRAASRKARENIAETTKE